MGIVNFTNPLTNGQTTFFSLELAPTVSPSITVAIIPEPSTLLMGLVGLTLFPILRNRKHRNG